MVQVSVTTPALGFSAASMTGALANFDAQLAQAAAAVNAVVGSTWTGSAADAFITEWNAFLQSANLTRDALASIAMRLHGAQAAYESNEAVLVAAARSSRVNAQTRTGAGSGTSGGEQAPPSPPTQERPKPEGSVPA